VHIETIIKEGICVEISDARSKKNKNSFISSCIGIQFDNKSDPNYGEIIDINKDRTHFVTNDAAFELHDNRWILATVQLIEKPNKPKKM
jgi:hypothetical protein